jgi:hypothetical protein
MNQRIQELALQADLIRYPSDLINIKIEKFAELIVRECMDLLEDYTTDVHVGGIQYNVLSADETLQKHFGVERD